MWKLSTIVVSVLIVFIAVCWFNSNTKTDETFHGKNVVITGASSGIGEQLAYRFCEQEANIILVARREEKLKNVAEKCKILGATTVTYIPSDLSSIEEGQHFFQKVFKHFRTTDVLVLNHILFEVQRWHGNKSINDVTDAFNTNVISYINLATLFLPSLQASNGRLVVISSALGLFTYPYFALYCSNKHALHGFFNALRQDLALERTGDEGMSITLSILGAIETENALKASHGNPIAGEKGWTRFSPVDASGAVINATLRRERQMYFPYTGTVLHEVFSFHFPSFVERVIRYVYNLN